MLSVGLASICTLGDGLCMVIAMMVQCLWGVVFMVPCIDLCEASCCGVG
jgi:hypothetical protein